ncbi:MULTISPECIES: hypothetical protein [unclassified Kribbella]|uniref:hypothetical protein n=1 Tax=unclassified Kribbella TaxID=2644121 RepID=UPI0030789547
MFVQARRGTQLVGLVVVQASLVALSYVIGQVFLAMAPKRSGPPAGLAYLRATRGYDHWTEGSLVVVQVAVALVLLTNLVCLVKDPDETPLPVLSVLVGGFGALLCVPGIVCLLLALTDNPDCTFGVVAAIGLLVALLVGWAFLFAWSGSLARRLVVDVAAARVR